MRELHITLKEWKMTEPVPNLRTLSTGAQRLPKSPTRYFWEGKEVQMITAGVHRAPEALIGFREDGEYKKVTVPKSEITCRNAN